MNRKLALSSLALFAVLALAVSSAHAADSFFAGKTMHIMVAASPGGGFDAYSRMLARHMPRHIPGNPTIIVQNRPGAGGRITANYMYNKAKPDGLTMGMWIGGLILQQYLGDRGVRFDAAKFEWVGAPVRIHNVCMAHKSSGVGDLAAWRAALLDTRPELVTELNAINTEMLAEARRRRPSRERLFQLDNTFHRSYVFAGAGPRLLVLNDSIKPQAERYIRLYVDALIDQIAVSVNEHEKIVKAIESGDPDQAQATVRTNWRNAAERLSGVIARAGELGSW